MKLTCGHESNMKIGENYYCAWCETTVTVMVLKLDKPTPDEIKADLRTRHLRPWARRY